MQDSPVALGREGEAGEAPAEPRLPEKSRLGRSLALPNAAAKRKQKKF